MALGDAAVAKGLRVRYPAAAQSSWRVFFAAWPTTRVGRVRFVGWPLPTSDARSGSRATSHSRSGANPLERVNGGVKRRADVVRIFPNDAAIVRLAGVVLIETHDESQVIERRYFSEGSMAAINASGSVLTTT